MVTPKYNIVILKVTINCLTLYKPESLAETKVNIRGILKINKSFTELPEIKIFHQIMTFRGRINLMSLESLLCTQGVSRMLN